MSKKITIKNIFWYLQGNTRYKVLNNPILKYLVAGYIRRQIAVRKKSVDEVCNILGSCKECGCSIPQLQYADVECHGWCYPPMLKKNDFLLLENGGCYEDPITKITWRITNGKFHYKDISRNA